LLHVVTLCVLVSFLLRQKDLATDQASDLSHVCPRRHCNCYADMIFNEFKTRL